MTLENVEEYVELMTDFCLHTGIRKQLEAFKGMVLKDFFYELGKLKKKNLVL